MKLIMAVKTITECRAVVIALLILCVAVDEVHSCVEFRKDEVDEYYEEYEKYKTKQRQKLLKLFEAAIVSNNSTLWKLQQIYFNPDSNQSPEQVCLSVFVTVNTITNPNCTCNHQKGQAFAKYDDVPNQWRFNSYYELQLANDVSEPSELAELMTKSGSTGVFYAFDPSFYSIMKTLSSSIAVSFPYIDSDDHLYYYSNDYVRIDITINTELDEMPCWDDAVYALRSVLMWVSFVHK